MPASPNATSRRHRTRSSTSSSRTTTLTTTSALLLLALTLTLPPVAHADLLRKPLAIHPEDRYASPKFDVRIWNHLPIKESEAREWLTGSVRWQPQRQQQQQQQQEGSDDAAEGSASTTTTTAGLAQIDDHIESMVELFRGNQQVVVDASSLRVPPRRIDDAQQHPFSSSSGTSSSIHHLSSHLVRMKLPGSSSSSSTFRSNHSSTSTLAGSQALDDDYLCLLPATHKPSPSPKNQGHDQQEQEQHQQRAIDPPPSPMEAWSSLDHLHGACLFHRQGWFTYRYCHDQSIRQFREAPHKHPHPAGGYVPIEDENYDAYDLGLSPREASHRAAELARKKAATAGGTSGSNAGGDIPSSREIGIDTAAAAGTAPQAVQSSPIVQSRYLTQTWTDGTLCDKTGEPRMTEVQFHCKMNGVDEIAFIKEVSTCEYILVIHTPRLCSLPGFHVPSASDEPSRPITCRQIIPDEIHDRFLSQRIARIEERERFFLIGGVGYPHATHAQAQEAGSAGSPPAPVLNPVQRHVFEERMRQVRAQGDRYPEGYYSALPHSPGRRTTTGQQNGQGQGQGQVQQQRPIDTKHIPETNAMPDMALAPQYRQDEQQQHSSEDSNGDDNEDDDDDTEVVEVEVILMDEEGNEVPFVATQRVPRRHLSQGNSADGNEEAEWQDALDEGILSSAEDVIRGIIADMNVGVGAAAGGGAGIDELDRQDWLRGLVERATLELQRHAEKEKQTQHSDEGNKAEKDKEEREKRREL